MSVVDNQDKILNQANITIEAAFVFPVIIYLIFALIYLAFYLHDRCVIQGTADKVLYSAAVAMKHDAEITTGAIDYERIKDQRILGVFDRRPEEQQIKIKGCLQQELVKKLFLLRLSSVEVKADMYRITVNIGAVTKVKLPLFGRLFDRYSYTRIEQSSSVHNPAETIRMAEVILDTGSEIKGVNELKEAVEKFLRRND